MAAAAERRNPSSCHRATQRGQPHRPAAAGRRLVRTLAGLAIAIAATGAPDRLHAQAVLPALERGRALYETRCIACHDRSVHRRESRKAADFPALRAQVSRWSETAGGEWKAEEIDAVTVYLNDRYYR